MKRFRFIIFFSLMICCLLAAVGCKGPKLATPTDFVMDDHELVLSWGEIENADYYEISINGETDDSKKNSCSLEKLEAGDYVIKVRACYDGKEYSHSAWSNPYEFKREEETGVVYRLSEDGTSYEVANMGLAEGHVVIPATYRNKPVTSIGKAAFRKKDKLTAVTLPETITSIGNQAFISCKNLTSINIPAAVQSIGTSAFNGCESLEIDLVIPEGITEIAENAFAYCKKIKSITLPSTVELIRGYAFTSCEAVTEITFPAALKEIKEYTFSDCFALSTVEMGTGLEVIGASAFYGCTGLVNVTVGENVKVILDNAYQNCVNLETVTVPDSVVQIGNYVFYGCSKLTSVDLGEGLKQLGVLVFTNTKLLDDQEDLIYVDGWLVDYIPETILEIQFSIGKDQMYEIEDGTVGIAAGALAGTAKLENVIIPDSVQFIGLQAFSGCPDLSSVVIGAGVKFIDQYAFYMCEKLANVALGSYDFATSKLVESSLEEIAGYAFYQCSQLSKIEIPETVKKIGVYAFRKTYMYNNSVGVVYAGNWAVDYAKQGGASIEIKDGTVGIAEYAFYRNDYMQEVIIPESVKYYGESMFLGSVVMYVTLPSNIKEIPNYTFSNCQNLLSINFPEGLERIGDSAFYGTTFLGLAVDENWYVIDTAEDFLVLPDSLVSIGDLAFYGLGLTDTNPETGEVYEYGIDKIVFGDGLKTIGQKAFYNCVTVEEIAFGAGLEKIGARAFYNCNTLKTVTFGNSVNEIGTRAFYKCKALTALELPETLTTIEEYTFYQCESLRALTFNGDVTSVGKYAFYGCKVLEELYLPVSLTDFGKYAFRNAKTVTSVTVSDNVTVLPDHAFYGFTSATIYVEAASKPENWSNRWNTSFRPVVWGVTLSADQTHVVSFTKSASSFTNVNEKSTFNAPTWKGHTFEGWTTVEGGTTAEYAANEIANVADGTTLYAVWA